MNTQGQAKCAYSWCKCIVGTKEKYCSDYCADADDEQEPKFSVIASTLLARLARVRS